MYDTRVMQPQIEYATTADGVSIDCRAGGAGPPRTPAGVAFEDAQRLYAVRGRG